MADQSNAEYRCFVRDLAWSTDKLSLRQAFSPYGNVISAMVINARNTTTSRGYGTVTFSREQSMRDAIEGMNGQILDGGKISVRELKSPFLFKDRSGAGGGGGGGGGGGNGGGAAGEYGGGRLYL